MKFKMSKFLHACFTPKESLNQDKRLLQRKCLFVYILEILNRCVFVNDMTVTFTYEHILEVQKIRRENVLNICI